MEFKKVSRGTVSISLVLVIIAVALISFVLYSYLFIPPAQKTARNQPWELVSETDLNNKFKAAVADAKDANVNEIDKNLTVITPENKNLVRDDQGRILVLAFTSYGGYDDKVNTELPLSKEIWITVTPEMETFCRAENLDSANMAIRIEQLLGLPAGQSANKRFVAMWVSPDDLYRPCPDPEINDSECELDYPKSPYTALSPDYLSWFEHQKSISYLDDGYPWTRLGYTYDWGKTSEIGLSEFIVKPGARIKVEGVWPTEKYLLEKCGVPN